MIRRVEKIIFAAALMMTFSNSMAKDNSYQPEWDSLVNYEAPEWYEDAKLGFWFIWGIYSVPAFKGDHAAEWYGRWLYCHEGQSGRNNEGLATHQHHVDTYGDPSAFGYKDFIPLFKGSEFNADEWAKLSRDGGAKFVTSLAVFHDAFAMWDSDVTKYNSMDMGPKRDIVGELKTAAHKYGLKFGVSNHSGWNYAFFAWNHINEYDAKGGEFADLYGSPIITPDAKDLYTSGIKDDAQFNKALRSAVQPSQHDLDRWLAKANELTDRYQPDLHYFDWGFNIAPFEPYRRAFAAHYYNNSIMSGKGRYGAPGVVINYKKVNTFKPGSAVLDLERRRLNEIQDMVWQTDDSVYGGHNWSYVDGEPIKSVNTIIDQLMDVISKRGVLMLAIAPDQYGNVPDDQRDLLLTLGRWLNVCGEAVYSTRPYTTFGESSFEWDNTLDEAGRPAQCATCEDIRYTRSKDNTTIYATYLDWPGDKATIKSFNNIDDIESIQLVGDDGDLRWSVCGDILTIELGDKPDYDYAYPIRIRLKK